MRLATLALGLAAASVGCSLLVSVDGLTGGPPPAGSDAGDATALPEAAANDSGADAADAGDAADGAAQGCARFPDASFCEDFSDPSTALSSARWTSTDVGTPNGSITIVDGAARLALDTAPTACEYVQLSKSIPGPASSFITRLTVRPDTTGNFLGVIARPSTTPSATYRVIVSFAPVGTGTQLYAFVQKHDMGVFTELDDGTIDFPTNPIGRSFELTVEMATAPTPKVLLSIDGRTLSLAPPPDLVIQDPHTFIGPYCRGKSTIITVDDVALWATP